jgi:predicted site-specific integrase-resolvase
MPPKSNPPSPTLITVAAFCNAYSISRSSLYRQFNAGLIPIVKCGRSTRIRTADAERWAANLSNQNKAA